MPGKHHFYALFSAAYNHDNLEPATVIWRAKIIDWNHCCWWSCYCKHCCCCCCCCCYCGILLLQQKRNNMKIQTLCQRCYQQQSNLPQMPQAATADKVNSFLCFHHFALKMNLSKKMFFHIFPFSFFSCQVEKSRLQSSIELIVCY